MKKKIFSVLFALVLVLSFSLVTAVPAGAQETLHVVPFELQEWGSATAEWSTEKANIGTYSAKLTIPVDTDGWDNMAAVKVPYGEALSTITNADFKYWYWQAATGSLYGVLYIDSGGGDVVDRLLVSQKAADNTATSTWTETAQEDQWTEVGYDPETKLFTTPTHGTTWGTLAEWQTTYPHATLLYAAAAWGYFADRVVYIDDITINGVTYYGLIQDAIDSAADETILVADGTYTEDLVVDTANLTLKSVNGRDFTTIQGVDDWVIELQDGSSGFTLGGAEGAGFTVLGHETAGRVLLQTWGGPSGVTLSYNTFDTTGETNMAIAVGSGGAADLSISNNTFELYKDSSGQITGIYFDTGDVTNLVIDSNTFNRQTGTPKWLQWAGNAHVHGATISNNIVNRANVAIRMYSRTNLFENVTFSGNTIDGGYIAIGCGDNNSGDGVITSLSITGNSFTGPAFEQVFLEILSCGVDATDIDWETLSVTGNNFDAAAGEWAIKNWHSTTLNAEGNWWGNASGPTHGNNPDGTGALITSNVDYEPWLLEPVVIGEMPPTYDQIQPLKDGWTLVSTDKAIDTTATSWEGVTLAYKYAPSTAYVEATVADLEPVNALYLKTEGGGGIGITYSGGIPVASCKDLEPSWNLISSATTDTASAVLSPLRYVQVGDEQGVGLTTVVSQGNYNRNIGSFYLPTLTETDWTKLTFSLSPFDGYWVYMNAAKNFGVVPN